MENQKGKKSIERSVLKLSISLIHNRLAESFWGGLVKEATVY